MMTSPTPVSLGGSGVLSVAVRIAGYSNAHRCPGCERVHATAPCFRGCWPPRIDRQKIIRQRLNELGGVHEASYYR